MKQFMTGYYGVPGSSRGNFTVHVIDDVSLRPICKWRPRHEMQFQWCADGIQWNYIECETCRRLCKPILAAIRALSQRRSRDNAVPRFASWVDDIGSRAGRTNSLNQNICSKVKP